MEIISPVDVEPLFKDPSYTDEKLPFRLRRFVSVHRRANDLKGVAFLYKALDREDKFLKFTMVRMQRPTVEHYWERDSTKPISVQLEWRSTTRRSTIFCVVRALHADETSFAARGFENVKPGEQHII